MLRTTSCRTHQGIFNSHLHVNSFLNDTVSPSWLSSMFGRTTHASAALDSSWEGYPSSGVVVSIGKQYATALDKENWMTSRQIYTCAITIPSNELPQ